MPLNLVNMKQHINPRHKEILKKLREEHGFSQTELAKLLGINRNNIGSYEEGRANIPHKVIRLICEQFDLPYDPFFEEDEPGRTIAFRQREEEPRPVNVFLIPSKSAAGYERGYTDEPEIETLVPFFLPNLSNDRHVAIEIAGDSMVPKIPNGSIVVGKKVERITDFQDGKIYLLRTLAGGGYLCKRLYRDKDSHIRLESENPEYEPMYLPEWEISDIYLMVKAIVDPN